MPNLHDLPQHTMVQADKAPNQVIGTVMNVPLQWQFTLNLLYACQSVLQSVLQSVDSMSMQPPRQRQRSFGIWKKKCSDCTSVMFEHVSHIVMKPCISAKVTGGHTALLLFGSKSKTVVATYLPLDKSAEVTAPAECSSMATSLLELMTVICRAGRTACIKSTESD